MKPIWLLVALLVGIAAGRLSAPSVWVVEEYQAMLHELKHLTAKQASLERDLLIELKASIDRCKEQKQ
jgi:hypothetical protein